MEAKHNNPCFNFVCLIVAVLQFAIMTVPGQDASLPRDDAWRKKELQRAIPLLREHDFSPFDEAFAAKDIKLLWHYYIGDYRLKFQLYMAITPEVLASPNLDPTRRARMVRAKEQAEHAGRYLMRLPGHARMLGDMIEETNYERGGGVQMRRTYFTCLARLAKEGSDECIEQLGRFLFDKRDPSYVPFDPAKDVRAMYDSRGASNPVQNDAASALLAAVKGRFSIGEELTDADSKPFKGMPIEGYAEKLRHWWLNSAEAAPYRRSLAATGVVLPPGYPAMKELEGTQTKIAPPLRNPPYPNEEPRSQQPPQPEDNQR